MKRVALAMLVASAVVSCSPAATELDAGAPDALATDDAPRDDAGRDVGESDAPLSCTPPDRDRDGADAMACGGLDCDDDDPARAPGRPEVCDATDLDEDCDPSTYGARDLDADGHDDAACCNGTTCGDDCDDARADVYAGLLETCDGRDNDCNMAIDEGVLLAFYPDADGDDFGAMGSTAVLACVAPANHASLSSDCDDGSASRNPGLAEVCDGLDNDCDMVLDGPGEDDDGDMHADDNCAGTGASDCDDVDATIHDGAPELCNRIDDDCSTPGHRHLPAGVPENAVAAEEDVDSDGHAPIGAGCSGGTLPRDDCRASDAAIHPAAAERCNLLDDDCDTAIDDGADAACMLTGATARCDVGVCQVVMCVAPAGDCNTTPADGCEIDTTSDVRHCGGCGAACPPGGGCTAGTCRPVHDWSRRGGSAALDYIDGMAAGGGLVCIHGAHGGPASFGGGTLPGSDVFIACFDAATGAHRWSMAPALSGTAGVAAMAIDAAGNVYYGGWFGGPADFGGGVRTATGPFDGYVAARGPTGTLLWDRPMRGSAGEQVSGLAIGPSGELYAAGYFDGADAGIGAATFPAASGGSDAFLARCDTAATGAPVWTRTFGAGYPDYATGVAADASGVYVTGQFGGSVNFGGGTLVTSGLIDLFVAGYALADGAYRWQRRAGTPLDDAGGELAVGGGTVGMVTTFSGAITLNGGAPTTLTSPGTSFDGLVAAYAASDGALRWARQMGNTEYDAIECVVADPSGGLVVGGYFEMTIDLGTGPLVAVGTSDALLARWDAGGVARWARRFGTTGYSGVWALGGSSTLWIAGNFESSIGLGGPVLSDAGLGDVFVARFSP